MMAAKKILAVAVGSAQPPFDVLQQNIIQSGLISQVRQAILRGLRDGLQQDWKRTPITDFDFDYLEADRGPNPADPWDPMRNAIGSALPISSPDLIFPIAYHATLAAKKVVDAGGPPKKPIIFVVVSDPKECGIVTHHPLPKDNITGYSTMLRQTTHECLEYFKQTSPGLQTVHAMHQPDMPSATDAIPALDRKAKQLGMKPIQYKVVNSRTDIQTYVSGLPQQPTLPTVGLLVIGDDLVVSETKKFLPTASSKNIPVFVQVLEFVNPPLPSALGGYGVPGDAIGRAAADYVNGVLWVGENPGGLPVEWLYDFEWWVNTGVAGSLGLTMPAPYYGLAPKPVRSVGVRAQAKSGPRGRAQRPTRKASKAKASEKARPKKRARKK